MSLLSQTAALGIYDLRPGSMIRCEIESYQAALDLLPPLLASVSSLPDRMSSEQLGRWCALYGFTPPEGMKEDAVRRALAECIRGCGWTVPEIEDFLERLGAVVSIEEQTGRLMVRGDFSPGFFSDVETLLRTIGQLAPAGLEIANDLYGLSWDQRLCLWNPPPLKRWTKLLTITEKEGVYGKYKYDRASQAEPVDWV